MSYTEGKWLRLRDSCVIAEGKLNDGFVISDCYGPDQEGNSHLIACAPSLLETLELARNFVYAYCEEDVVAPGLLVKIEAAIAAARGTV